MTTDRWTRVEQLFHQAASLGTEERQAFLAEHCGGDEELRVEVESLLSQQAAAGHFLDEPALHAAARAVAAAGGEEVGASVLGVGTRLGPYEIEAMTGSGGMGEVYKARDTRLDRHVAIKVLPSHLNADAGRRARFEREAKAVAALSHPNICTLHDVGEHRVSPTSPPALYLVMEYLAGETLFQRLRKGPLPLDRALAVATDIAAALACAHRQGIVHRDLKPGNVMLTKNGIKLLDFGLARLTGHGEQPAVQTGGPAASAHLTAQGLVVGTLHYMAPEQLQGRAADARTDLWALGCLLYEMATGRQPFEGSSSVSVMAAILEREPPAVTSLQPLAPPALERLVRRLLAKDPDQRPDTAHDVAAELQSIAHASAQAATVIEPTRLRGRRRIIGAASGLLGLVVLAAVAVWLITAPHNRTPSAPMHLELPVSPAAALHGGAEAFTPTRGGARTAFAWTPDGESLVFVGLRDNVRQLFVRRLREDNQARPIAGTVGAHGVAVSPDGASVVFWADGAIRKAPLPGGGPPTDLLVGVSAPPWGLAVEESGAVLFGREGAPISRVDANGTATAVTRLREGELSHGLPSPLPGGALLYTVRKRDFSWGDEEVVAEVPATGRRSVLVRDAADGRLVSPDQLVFLRRGWLLAVRFDPKRLMVSGAPRALRGGVAQAMFGVSTGDTSGAGQYAISADGTLAAVSQPEVPWEHNQLVRVDRQGQVTPLPAPRNTYGVIRRSPDGRRLAVVVGFPGELAIAIYDLTRGTLTQRTHGGEAVWPLWSPDGRSMLFGWLKDGRRHVAAAPVDSASEPEKLLDGAFYVSGFSGDGRRILAVRNEDGIVSIPWVASGQVVSPERVQSVIETPNQEQWPDYSPDKRWIVYGTRNPARPNERNQIYVCQADDPRSSVPVSVNGGSCPAWNPNGRELFFVGPVDRSTGKRPMMAVDFRPGNPPRLGTPHRLFDFDPVELDLGGSPLRVYEVANDGRSFYAVKWPPTPIVQPVTHIELSIGWWKD